MITEEISYEAGGLPMKGLARLEGDGRWPAILVAHESFGLSQHTRDVSVRFRYDAAADQHSWQTAKAFLADALAAATH